MSEIKATHNPSEEKFKSLGILSWPRKKEVSEFPWHYDDEETCYILEGDSVMTPGGDSCNLHRRPDDIPQIDKLFVEDKDKY